MGVFQTYTNSFEKDSFGFIHSKIQEFSQLIRYQLMIGVTNPFSSSSFLLPHLDSVFVRGVRREKCNL